MGETKRVFPLHPAGFHFHSTSQSYQRVLITEIMCTLSPQSPSTLFLLFHLVNVLSICLAEQLNGHVLDGDVPYCGVNVEAPFTYSDNHHGLQVICDFEQKSTPKIALSGTELTLLEISREEGYIRVLVKPTMWRCNQRVARPIQTSTGNQTQAQYLADLNLDLEGTPFTYSHDHNKLTVLGCDAFVMLENSVINGSSGCVSFCPNVKSIKDGKCMGAGCCQSSIPPGLKSFNITSYSIKNLTASSLTGINGCTQFFVGEMDPSQFKSKYVVGDHAEFTSWPVVLEWAIGNESCARAMPEQGYACLASNSSCHDVNGGKGYRCKCNDGFEGNPYVLGGCQDIDECRNSSKNNCTWKCENFIGGVRCLCPLGTKGDGIGRGGCERSEALEIGLALGLVLLTILFTGGILSYWGLKKRKIVKTRRRYFMQNGGMLLQQRIYTREQSARIFSIYELRRATNGFSEEQVIGKGGYGTVYKGVLSDGQVVAIKKSKLVDESQIEQFINEVVILSQINHKNVVKLLGCCLEDPVPLLIYEFIPNGTLFHHIHENSRPLTWENRLRVATETASALAYIHCKAAIPIIHRDIKLTNILLDDNYTAKISDFGASRLVGFNQTHITTLVQGTLGYLDPEYFLTSQLTDKSDVYSFGVVLMEMLTRQKPVSFWKSDKERNLASHFVISLRKGQLHEVIDRQLLDQVGPLHLFATAELASRCVEIKGEERPTMYEVAVELNALRRLLKNQFAMLPLDKEQPYFRRPMNICKGNPNRETNPEISLLSSIDI